MPSEIWSLDSQENIKNKLVINLQSLISEMCLFFALTSGFEKTHISKDAVGLKKSSQKEPILNTSYRYG